MISGKLGNAFLVGLTLFIVAAVVPVPAWAEGGHINVTGDADVRVVPDEVVVTLGVETSDKDMSIAKSQNDERIKKVLAITEAHGIDPKYVQTEYINIEPRYRYENDHEEFLGYFVRKTVVITLKDISKFESLLSSVLEAGVNFVHGVEFRTTELRKYRDQARALAIKAAREKADALASELGQKAGKALSINESHGGWWSSYGSSWGSRWGSNVAQNVVQNVGEAPPTDEGTLAPGQITVNASVSVDFELN